ncbi:MAG: tetratricopeptide repeat protein [Cyanobacteriota bacterium]
MNKNLFIIILLCLLLSSCWQPQIGKYYYPPYENYYKKIRQDPDNLDLCRELAEKCTKKKKIEAAYEVYQYIIRKAPNDYKSYNDVGYLFYLKANSTKADLKKQHNYFSKALENYNKVLELKPDYARAKFNKGYILQRLGRSQEALALYNEALKLDPEIIEANNNLGIIYLCDLKDNKKGYDYILKATQQDPGCIKRYGKAYANLIFAKNINKIGTITLFDKFKILNAGVKNADCTDLKEYCETPFYSYTPLLSKDITSPAKEFPFKKKPQSVKEYYKLAKYYEENYCHELAIKYLDLCIEKDSKNYEAYELASDVYSSNANENRNKQKANEYIDTFLELDPDYIPALISVASRYIEYRLNENQEWEDVITDPKFFIYVDKIYKLEPMNPWALYNKGKYYQTQKNDFEKASEYYIKCKMVDPEYKKQVNKRLTEMGKLK